MAAVSLFWDTNMAAVTSCEIMYISKPVGSQFGQMVRKTMVSFILESFHLHKSLNFTAKQPLKPETLFFFFV